MPTIAITKQHLEANPPVMIPVELLTTGTIIYRDGGDFGPFGGFAQVMSVADEGDDGFYLRVLIDGWHEEVAFYVERGESLRFGGVGEPVLSDAPDAFLARYQGRQAEIARELIRQQDDADEGWRTAEADARAEIEKASLAAVAGALGLAAE